VGNPDNTRTTIGIGEAVDFGGMPGSTVWSVSGGGSLSGTTFTANMSPGAAIVTAQVGSVSIPTPLKIVAPDGIAVTVKTDIGLGAPGTTTIGANTLYNVKILPTSVSFVNVSMRENISPAVTNTWPNGSKFYGKGVKL